MDFFQCGVVKNVSAENPELTCTQVYEGLPVEAILFFPFNPIGHYKDKFEFLPLDIHILKATVDVFFKHLWI